MSILVTGGLGYIGSHTVVELNKSVNKQEIINHFTNHNVIFDWYSMGVQKIRIVTHLDYTEKDHKALIEIVDKL